MGGCVRDLLLGHKPKDFDVATDAHPGEVRAIFRNCRLIGRRFRLAHVYFRGRQGHRGRHLPGEPGRRGRRPGRRGRPAHHPRQRLRHRRGGRRPPRLHRERPLLRRGRRRGDRLRGRARGPGSAPDPHHRRSRDPHPRGPGAHAPGGALRRPPRLRHRAGHLRGHAPPRRRAGPLRAGPGPGGDLQDPPLRRVGACLRAPAGLRRAPDHPPGAGQPPWRAGPRRAGVPSPPTWPRWTGWCVPERRSRRRCCWRAW